MRELKRNPANQIQYLAKFREKTVMDGIVNTGGDALIRYGNFSHEIIDGRTQYIFPPDKKASDLKQIKKGLFLFQMVRKNAKEWLKKNPDFKVPKKNPVNQYNRNYNKIEYRIAGTDLNNAYWTIAFNLGIISRHTYTKGLEDEKGFKTLRLAALSTLGAGKKYMRVKEGELTTEEVRIGRDERLADVYKLIRYRCYIYMTTLMKKLKNDFVAYRTDCIYYANTPENRQMVKTFFDSKKLMYKQLYDNKKPPVQTDGNDLDHFPE